jgi:hypothetical protein
MGHQDETELNEGKLAYYRQSLVDLLPDAAAGKMKCGVEPEMAVVMARLLIFFALEQGITLEGLQEWIADEYKGTELPRHVEVVDGGSPGHGDG